MPSILTSKAFFEGQANDLTAGDRRIAQGKAQTAASLAKLPVDGLMGAGFHTSKNSLLAEIWTEVSSYNSSWRPKHALSPQDTLSRVGRLDYILHNAAQYMTSKWAKDCVQDANTKRVKRWDCLKGLIEAIALEMELLGARSLTAPADWKLINKKTRSYWLERIDTNHRPGWVLSQMYEQWLLLRPVANGAPVPFFDWLQSPAASTLLVGAGLGTDANRKVAYRANSDPLADCELYFDTGKLHYLNDRVFTTKDRKTEFSGLGWAIWVCGLPDLNGLHPLYSSSHVYGAFHHSSFLSGLPVAAAGEWIVDLTGKVCVMTAKTGHYKTTPSDMKRLLTLFPAIPDTAVIRPDLKDTETGAKKAIYYRVGDFKARGLNATPINRAAIMAALPTGMTIDTTQAALPA